MCRLRGLAKRQARGPSSSEEPSCATVTARPEHGVRYQTHRGRLAGAVRSQKAYNDARADGEGEIADGAVSAVVLREVDRLDHPSRSYPPHNPAAAVSQVSFRNRSASTHISSKHVRKLRRGPDRTAARRGP